MSTTSAPLRHSTQPLDLLARRRYPMQRSESTRPRVPLSTSRRSSGVDPTRRRSTRDRIGALARPACDNSVARGVAIPRRPYRHASTPLRTTYASPRRALAHAVRISRRWRLWYGRDRETRPVPGGAQVPSEPAPDPRLGHVLKPAHGRGSSGPWPSSLGRAWPVQRQPPMPKVERASAPDGAHGGGLTRAYLEALLRQHGGGV